MYSTFAVASILIEAISIALYIRVLFGIYKSKNIVLKSPFFMLFLSTGISDVISAFVNAIMRHLTTYRIGPDEGGYVIYLYRTTYLLSGLTFYAHFIGCLLFSLNRCTSVALPERHGWLWTRSHTYLYILIQWGVSFGCVAFRIPAEVRFLGKSVFVGYASGYSLPAHVIAGSVCGIVSLFSLFLSALTLYHLLNYKEISRTKTEYNLAVYSIVSFLSCLLMDWQQFTKVYFSAVGAMEMIAWISEQYFWINDILIFCNLYSILLCSKHVREMLMHAKWSDRRFHVCRSASMAVVSPLSSRAPQVTPIYFY